MPENESVEVVVERWLHSPLRRQFVAHRILDGTSARTCPLPDWVEPRLRRALARRGVERLYSHQARAVTAVWRTSSRAGISDRPRDGARDVVVATPTASGKTLCYNLPVFQTLLADPGARAIYLFPTKALARDQVEEARALANELHEPIGVAVYDGDTPPDERRAARRKARIIATNPEMLHAGILPHHPAWSELLAGLRYVVIDELHVYRGVFGSHVAHLLRRLVRLARFHGADPVFICSSATIANPDELAGRLIGRPVERIDDNGAPRGRRHLMIYNPPLVDEALGIRQSYLKASCTLTRQLVESAINTLAFCRTRQAVEVLLRYLRDTVHADRPADEPRPCLDGVIRGYRGGYLPARRRAVEQGLRRGDTRAVVATSALELGIDIGALDAVVIAGWPGSRAAAWQRAGRAGRRLTPSLAVLVACSEPLDQFVAEDPEFLFGQQPEHALIDPHNAAILVPQIKCAAYELPFVDGERYGDLDPSQTGDLLDCLAEARVLHHGRDRFSYVGDAYPAGEVDLRGPADENFAVILDGMEPQGQVIAEVDYLDATQELHEHAIYQLEGRQYQVVRLDHDDHRAHVVAVDVDYYTEALTQTRVRVLERTAADGSVCHGEVHVLDRVVGFKKIKLHTHENIGYGEVTQPDREKHTMAIWLAVPPPALRRLDRTAAEIAAASLGAAQLLHSAAALLLMGDARDLGRAVGDARSSWFPVVGRRGTALNGEPPGSDASPAPTIFLFDTFPGGTGLSERLFDERRDLLGRASRMIARCSCRAGCPACIGPGAGQQTKALAARLLAAIAESLARDERALAAAAGSR